MDEDEAAGEPDEGGAGGEEGDGGEEGGGDLHLWTGYTSKLCTSGQGKSLRVKYTKVGQSCPRKPREIRIGKILDGLAKVWENDQKAKKFFDRTKHTAAGRIVSMSR